jgi:hypothetical protein
MSGFAPLIDLLTGRSSLWKAKNGAAFVALSDPATGDPYAAATAAGQTTANATLTAINGKLPAQLNDRIPVEPLGVPGVARQLAAGVASANTALTSTVRRISIYARTADIRYAVGSTSQTASATTSHFIALGERLDIDVPATPNIAVIRAGSVDGVLEVTELS